MSEESPPPASHPPVGTPHGNGRHEEEESGAPEWLISFADNTALLMGFFVILLAMNMAITKTGGGPSESEVAEAAGQTAAALDWAIAIREGFNNPVDLDSTAPGDRLLVARLHERLAASGRDDAIPGPHDTSQSLRPSEHYGSVASVGFAADSSRLAGDGAATLQAAASELRGLRLIVEVRGYVSPAEAYDEDDRGMRLSFERAMAAARRLVDAGMTWKQLRVIACGSTAYQREYDPEQQARHQRVDLIKTDELVADR